MAEERSRRQLLYDAGLDSLANCINLSGPTALIAKEIVRLVCQHGRTTPVGETASQGTLEITWEVGDRKGESNALGSLGIAYNFLGKYRQAIVFYEQHLEIARKIGDRSGEGNALANLGSTQMALERYDEAMQNLQASLTIFREIQSPAGEAEVLQSFADLYLKIDRLDAALDACNAALDIATELGIPLARACQEVRLKIQNAKSKKSRTCL